MTVEDIEDLEIPLVPNPLEIGLVINVKSCQLPNIIVLQENVKKRIPPVLEEWLTMAEQHFPCNVEFGQLASFPMGKIYAEFVKEDGSQYRITRKELEGKGVEIGAELIGMLDNPVYRDNEEMFLQIIGNIEFLARDEKAFINSKRSTGYYIFRIKADKEEFYKGGIAYEPEKRASQIRTELKTKCKDVLVEIVQSTHAPDRPNAIILEQKILMYAEIMKLKYQPKVGFSGQSECFTCNPLDTIDLEAAEFLLRGKTADYGTGKYATLYVMGELKEESPKLVMQDNGLVLARIEWERSLKIFEYEKIVDFLFLDISDPKGHQNLIELISKAADVISEGKCSHRCGIQYRVDEIFEQFIQSRDTEELEVFKC